MRFRAIQDDDYVRLREALIPKMEKYAYEQTRSMGHNPAQRAAYSRVFLQAMQEEAERVHLTDGMRANHIVTMALNLKINVSVLEQAYGGFAGHGGDTDALG